MHTRHLPIEDLVGRFATRYGTGLLLPDRNFRSPVYQAIQD